MAKEYIGSDEHFIDEVNARYDKMREIEIDQNRMIDEYWKKLRLEDEPLPKTQCKEQRKKESDQESFE